MVDDDDGGGNIATYNARLEFVFYQQQKRIVYYEHERSVKVKKGYYACAWCIEVIAPAVLGFRGQGLYLRDK